MTSEDPTSSAVISAHRAWLEERIAALKTGARSAQEGMRVDGDHLRLHGVLPVGGYDGASAGTSSDEGEAWETVEVDSAVTLRAGGCLEVDSTTTRVDWPAPNGGSRTTAIKLPTAPSPMNGEDHSVYAFDVERDFSGAWQPKVGGGFERVATCSSPATPSGVPH